MGDADLIEQAILAREHAWAPYSGFLVGAALRSESGRVYIGCNIENVAYGATNCAERTAFFKAVSEGERHFEAIAVAGWPRGGESGFAHPCGICLQVMSEFCDALSFRIIVAAGDKNYKAYTLNELLPHGFSCAQL